MGATSSPHPTIAPLESGMLRLVLQPASLSRGIPRRSSLLLTLRTGSTSFLGLVTTLPACGTHFHMLPSDLPLVARSILNFLQTQHRRLDQGLRGWFTKLGNPLLSSNRSFTRPYDNSPYIS